MYDILGHPDVIKKFGHRPAQDYEPLERRALEALAQAGMALDVNTSGLNRPAKEIYPSPRILKAARAMGIDITFARRPRSQAVGDSFKEAVAQAKGGRVYIVPPLHATSFRPAAAALNQDGAPSFSRRAPDRRFAIFSPGNGNPMRRSGGSSGRFHQAPDRVEDGFGIGPVVAGLQVVDTAGQIRLTTQQTPVAARRPGPPRCWPGWRRGC